MQDEIWKKCVNWEDHLEVSNYGNVRSCTKVVQSVRNGVASPYVRIGKPLSQYINKSGYPEIAMQIDKVRKKISVHRLVALAFVDGYKEGLTVNHIDGVKTNNTPANLEWVTLSRNSEHQWEIGLVDLRGDNAPNKKLSSGKVRIIRDLIKLGATCNSLAVLLDVDPTLIYKIRDGERWASIL